MKSNHEELMSKALIEIKKLKAKIQEAEKFNEPIAIVGMSCRFPGGVNNPDQFWQFLNSGGDAVVEIPEDRWSKEKYFDSDASVAGKMYSKLGGFLQQPIDQFDYKFFGITPNEAKKMDPQQRLLLELTQECFYNASLLPSELMGSSTGVFVGLSGNDYLQLQIREQGYEGVDPYMTTGWAHSVASGRISYLYGLQGPSMAIDTACSSSLVALDLACSYLRSDQCQRALVGGVSLMLSPEVSINFSKAKMLSVDGKCKSFDANANGYVRGEGAGLVLIQRLSEAKKSGAKILAVINGSAVNQDGKSSGLTVPNGPAQERVLKDALRKANVTPDLVSYIETHGTGTSLGDPIEANALNNVYGKDRSESFYLGAVKTNIGHLEAAAGMASLIKAILCLQNKSLVKNLHFSGLNPHIDNSEKWFEVLTSNQEWKSFQGKRYAGISSFGFSGTNAHVILSEHSEEKPKIDAKKFPSKVIFKVAGPNANNCLKMAKSIQKLSYVGDELIAAAYKHNNSLNDFPYKGYVTADVHKGFSNEIEIDANSFIKNSVNQQIVFLFTGQGSQFYGMARELWASEGIFRDILQKCFSLFNQVLNVDLEDILFNNQNKELVHETIYTQPLLFSIEVALAKLWIHYGVTPNVIMGHSIGEIAAATIGDVLSLEDAVLLVSKRAQFINAVNVPGKMLSILETYEVALDLIKNYSEVSVAAINGEKSIVLSGNSLEIDQVIQQCIKENIIHKELKVSHAFHSPLMKTASDNLLLAIQQVSFKPSKIPLVSNVHGRFLLESEILDAHYWAQHVLAPVNFYQGLLSLKSLEEVIFIELGGQGVLSQLARKIKFGQVIDSSLLAKEDAYDSLWRGLGQCYQHSISLNWHHIFESYSNESVFIYPEFFAREGIWFKEKNDSQTRLTFGTSHFLVTKKEEISLFTKLQKEINVYGVNKLFIVLSKYFNQDSSIEKLKKNLGVIPKYQRLFDALMMSLEQKKLIKMVNNDAFEVVSNDLPTADNIAKLKKDILSSNDLSKFTFELLDKCLDSLTDIVSGKINYVDILFKGGDVAVVENVYKNNLVLKYFSEALAELLVDDIKQRQSSLPLKIIEIGAGTGGTAQYVFEKIDQHQLNVEYTYTDVSAGFTTYGKKEYGINRSYIEFKTLDIEKNPFDQGYDLGSYDVVIATNVIHATKNIDATLSNIEKLCKKGAVFYLNETTEVLAYTSLTFGLTDGWWAFEDSSLRLRHSPLLSFNNWTKVLMAAGFGEITSFECQTYQSIFKSTCLVDKDFILNKPIIKQESRQKKPLLHLSTISSEMISLVSDVSGLTKDEIAIDVNLFELGLDSLMLMSMKDAIEKKYHLNIETSSFYQELDTINKIVKHISESRQIELEENFSFTPQVSANDEMPINDGLQNFLTQQQKQFKIFCDEQIKQWSQIGSATIIKKSNASDKPNIRGFKTEKDPLNEVQQNFIDAFIVKYSKHFVSSKNHAQKNRYDNADWINSLGFRSTLKEVLFPLVMKECHGARFRDLDDNEMIDFGMGYGVSFFGNNVSFINDAIKEQLSKGMELGPQNHLAGPVSTLIKELTGVDRVSFCNSGTEAVMVSLRIARTVTKRNKIVLFSGSYHGTFDGILGFASKDGGAETQVIGTPDAMMHDVIILPYGDLSSLEKIKNLNDELAAVLVEPIQSRNPSLQPRDFLHDLRGITKDIGALLIFDEVLIGFRVAPGGAQAYYDVKADLVTYGKIVGGGMPIGVVAGSEKVMGTVDGGYWEYGDDSAPSHLATVFQGTFCKHPLAMAASYAVLKKLKEGGEKLQNSVNALTDQLAAQVNQFLEKEKIPLKCSHFASVFKFDGIGKLNPLLQPIDLDLLYLLMMQKGIYTWEKRICFLSTAHTLKDVNQFVSVFKECIAELRNAGFLNSDVSQVKDFISDSVHFKASAAQQRLFSLRSFEKGRSPYQLTAAFQIKGDLENLSLASSLQKIYQRHPLLHSKFELNREGELFVRYENNYEFSLDNYDVNGRTIDELRLEIEEEHHLEAGPAFLTRLYRVDNRCHYLFFTTHHSIIDGLSWDIFVQDLMNHIKNASPITIKADYQEFIDQQNKYLQSSNCEKDKDFWLKKLSQDELPILELPTDRNRPQRKSGRGDLLRGKVPKTLVKNIKECSKEKGVTVNMLLMTVYAVFLKKLTSQNRFMIGLPISGRPDSSFQNVIGMFANTIVLPVSFEKNKLFSEVLGQVKNDLLQSYGHQQYPFEKLVDQMIEDRDLSRNPIFDTMFVYEKGEKRVLSHEQCEFTPLDLNKGVSSFDLVVEMIETNDEMTLDLEYNTDILEANTIVSWQKYFLHLLEEVVIKNEDQISKLQLWSSEDQTNFLNSVNDTRFDYQTNLSLVDCYLAVCDQDAQSICTKIDHKQSTYHDVNLLSNGVAQKLIAFNHKIKRVAVYIDRCADYIPIILGILKSGAAFIPLEAKFGLDRIQFIIDDSNADCVIVDDENKAKNIKSTQFLLANDLLVTEENEVNYATFEKPAYLIYTSGSTGVPKGVEVPHHSVVNFALWRSKYYQMATNDSILQLASVSFDASISEIFPTLVSGGCIVFISEKDRLDIEKLAYLIETHQITHLCLTASFYSAFLNYLAADNSLEKLKSMRFITLAGEEATVSLIKKHKELLPNISVYNEYGPTENSVCATVYSFNDDRSLIGKPIDNNELFVLDHDGLLCPPGIRGQIMLSGKSLSNGYVNRPELNTKYFIEWQGKRVYATGDLATWQSDGNLDFKGRIDEQVKIRGYRIELGDIRSKMEGLKGVEEAVVIAVEQHSEKTLAAFVKSNIDLKVAEIKQLLEKMLPTYMVPSQIIVLKDFPKNNSGKIDQKSLVKLCSEKPEKIEEVVDQAIDNEKENKVIIKIFEKVLRQSAVKPTDNYFQLGGDSIKAIQVVSQLIPFGYHIQVADIFENPNVNDLSRVLMGKTGKSVVVYDESSSYGEYHLTPTQQWFIKAGGEYDYFNQSVLLKAKNGWNKYSVEEALRVICQKHPHLLAKFKLDTLTARVTRSDKSFKLKSAYLTSEDELVVYINKIQSGLNISKGEVFRCSLIECKGEEYLLMVAHHLVIDVISWVVLLGEFEKNYLAIIQQKEVELIFDNISFVTWAKSLYQHRLNHDIVKDMPRWQDVVQKISKGLLPYDHNELVIGKSSFHFEWGSSQSKQFSSITQNGKWAVSLIAFALLKTVNELYQQQYLSLDIETNGRQSHFGQEVDLTQTIGWFTNIHPVVLQMENAGAPLTYEKAKNELAEWEDISMSYGVFKYLSKQINDHDCPSIAINYLGEIDVMNRSDLFEMVELKGIKEVSDNRVLDHLIEMAIYQKNNVCHFEVNVRAIEKVIEVVPPFMKTFFSHLETVVVTLMGTKDEENVFDKFAYQGLTEEDLDTIFE